MAAGDGAAEQAARHARRAERIAAELSAGERAGSAAEEALRRARRQQRNWEAGATGERAVADALDDLRRTGWTFLHDLHWPDRPQANIDHIALGPGGVVVIDAKNWTGEVTIRDGVLRQNGYRRDHELEGVAQATAAVTALLDPGHRAATLGLVCLAGQDLQRTATSAGVPVVGLGRLAETLNAMPVRLSPYDVADIGRHLSARLSWATTSTRPSRARARKGPAPYASPPRPPAPRRASPRAAAAARRRRGAAVSALVRLVVILLCVLLAANMGSLAPVVAQLLFRDSMSSSFTGTPAAPPGPVAPVAPAPGDPAGQPLTPVPGG